MDPPIKEHGFRGEPRLDIEIVSPKNIMPALKSKDYRRERIQAIHPTYRKSNFIDKPNNSDFTGSKLETKFKYELYHWRANKKMNLIHKTNKSLETLGLVEKTRKLQNPETFR